MFFFLFFLAYRGARPPCLAASRYRSFRLGNQETATVSIKRSAIRFDRFVIQPLATKLRPPNRTRSVHVSYTYCATTSYTPFSFLFSLPFSSLFHPVAGEKKRIYLTDRSVLSRKILINEISTSVCVSLCEYLCTPLSQLSFVRSRYANHDSSRKTRVERCKAACGNSKVRAFARSRHRNYLGWKLSIRRSFCPRMNEILRNCNRGLPPRFVGQ